MSAAPPAIETVADEAGLETVAVLARRIWLEHYPALISRAQIDHMLLQGYSLPGMRAEIADGVRYRLARAANGKAIGFAAHGPEGETLWLHKLYVLADHRRSGVAAALLAGALEHAAERGCSHIRLRVNRGNRTAIAAYRRMGFAIERDDVKDIGHGFVMDDYIMRRAVSAQPGVSVNG